MLVLLRLVGEQPTHLGVLARRRCSQQPDQRRLIWCVFGGGQQLARLDHLGDPVGKRLTLGELRNAAVFEVGKQLGATRAVEYRGTRAQVDAIRRVHRTRHNRDRRGTTNRTAAVAQVGFLGSF